VNRVPLLAVTCAGLLSSCATVPPPARLEQFSAGTNAAGELCTMQRSWTDPAIGDPFDRAYLLTCSSAAANRPLGTLRALRNRPEAVATLEKQFDCGTAMPVALAGEAATARRCLDRVTGLESVRLDATRRSDLYVAAASPALLPQLEEALLVASGARAPRVDATRTPPATIDLSALPARPASMVAATVDSGGAAVASSGPLDVATALRQGIDLNHKGQHVEASRVLNDALSRLSAATPPGLHAELLLEAGLADSNILFADAARAHFAAADELLATTAARTAFLLRKRDAYLALDAINRRDFAGADAMLSRASAASPAATNRPLSDPATLNQLNQPRAGGSAGALAVPDAAQLSQIVLSAQSQYARSVALMAQGDIPASSAAIERAAAIYRPLANNRLDQTQLLWLDARIARQRGRLQARVGNYGEAVDNFDHALDMLRRSAIANAGTGNEPAIAEAEMERAAVFARTGASRTQIRNTFGDAVDSLIIAGSTTAGSSVGMEDYLDLLVREAATRPLPDTYDRFFRAIQASGEPAVARQITELRQVVTADPVVGAAVRERADLERELTRLRYAIADKRNGDKDLAGAPAVTGSIAALEQARSRAEARLIEVDQKLATDPRYRSLDESPASLAELRAALKPGEAFLKVTALGRRTYGLVVTADRTFAYHVADSEAARKAVDELARQLRGTIDGALTQGSLVPFDEARSYALFRLIAGPAAGVLAQARALVVDPAGPLERLPFGVLVKAYNKDAVRADAFDFSHTAFVARDATISTALSPRSFLVSRALPPSRAARPFLGLGQHQLPSEQFGARAVQVGFGCTADYGRLVAVSRSLKPISAAELTVAADALGVSATTLTGAAFTDTAIEARSDLSQFEVLHFATHGLEEGVWGCSKSPPALVTSFGGIKSDGLLDFAEIANLQLDANLVVLSACDTAAGVRDEALARASGQEESGSTLEGLVRAFLTANARAVLATYWQVSAESDSQEFIRTFYARARGATMGEAMRTAQVDLMNQPRFSHPFYWAPYFIVGDSAKTALTVPQPALRPAVAQAGVVTATR
jgi:CHAT domain-containing protein